MAGDADIAAVAAAIGEPARAAMLSALMGVRARPAGELARAGGVAASTASAHLSRLLAAGLVRVETQGRHRYYALASAEVAEAVEALAAVAPLRPVRSLRASNRLEAERAARSCYDHLAGALGGALCDRLCDAGALDRESLSLRDPGPLAELGVALPERRGRTGRPLTRACLDWTERRHHLAGSLGAALLDGLVGRGWLVRTERGRA